MNAENDRRCNRCKHQKFADGDNWCYMFEKRPECLPCGQHDKFAELRNKNGLEFLKNFF